MLRHLLASVLAVSSLHASAALISSNTNVQVRIDNFAMGHAAVDVTLDNFGTIGAGQLRGTLDGAGFLTYCTDLFQSFGWGVPGTYTLVDNGSAKGFSDVQATHLGKLYTAAGGDATNTNDSVAFQLAVWELLYDTGPSSVSAGNFRLLSGASSTQRDRADAWLRSALAPDAGSQWLAQRLVSPTAQDFVIFTALPQPTLRTGNVSEPGSAALAALALAGLLAARKRAA